MFMAKAKGISTYWSGGLMMSYNENSSDNNEKLQ